MEQGWHCPNEGELCVALVCGDGILSDGEECDDGNTTNGDGCSSTCEIEEGWECPEAGEACDSICGDGLVVGNEQCDGGPDLPPRSEERRVGRECRVHRWGGVIDSNDAGAR